MKLSDTQKTVLILAGVATIIVASIILYRVYRIPSSGIIASVNIEVYGNVGLTDKLIRIDCGFVYPSDEYTYTCWIKYTGNVNASLAFTTENWNPPNANVIQLETDFVPDTLIREGDVIKVVLKLIIPSDIKEITTFNFDIVITVYNL